MSELSINPVNVMKMAAMLGSNHFSVDPRMTKGLKSNGNVYSEYNHNIAEIQLASVGTMAVVTLVIDFTPVKKVHEGGITSFIPQIRIWINTSDTSTEVISFHFNGGEWCFRMAVLDKPGSHYEFCSINQNDGLVKWSLDNSTMEFKTPFARWFKLSTDRIDRLEKEVRSLKQAEETPSRV